MLNDLLTICIVITCDVEVGVASWRQDVEPSLEADQRCRMIQCEFDDGAIGRRQAFGITCTEQRAAVFDLRLRGESVARDEIRTQAIHAYLHMQHAMHITTARQYA